MSDKKRNKIIIGSRASRLAVIQAEEVIDLLKKDLPEFQFEIRRIRTSADLRKDLALDKFDFSGIFVKEIEEALLKEEIDLAVHSLKDLPLQLPKGLVLAAVPQRKSGQDVLVSYAENLPSGAKIGTSSLRRKAQLLRWQRNWKVFPLRGNIETRLKRLKLREFDGIVVSLASLERLKLEDLKFQILSLELMLPAPGQGALGIEIREEDREIKNIVMKINDSDTFRATQAEREFLRSLGGGCHVPIACLGKVLGDYLYLEGAVFSEDGKRFFREKIQGKKAEAEKLGRRLAEILILQGAKEILE